MLSSPYDPVQQRLDCRVHEFLKLENSLRCGKNLSRSRKSSKGTAMSSTSNRLSAIREKVEAGERLSFDDGVFLYEEADLFSLGDLADLVRERNNGNFAYYNV